MISTVLEILVPALLFLAISIPASIIDAKKTRIPDFLCFPGIILMTALRIYFSGKDSWIFFAAAVTYGACLEGVRLLVKKKLGLGDVKFSVFCGLYGGFTAIFPGLLCSVLFCLAWILLQKLRGNFNRTAPISFGPFLALGTFTCTIPHICRTLAQIL